MIKEKGDIKLRSQGVQECWRQERERRTYIKTVQINEIWKINLIKKFDMLPEIFKF